MGTKKWTVKSNICYGCNRFLKSNSNCRARCKEGGGHLQGVVPADCSRLTKFAEQYNMPCQCGETGVRYPLDKYDGLLHVYCKHCGWGIDSDDQPSYYANLSYVCGSSTLHYLGCGQLLRSKQSRDGFPYLVPKRCTCGGIPVLKIHYKHANESIETQFIIECNTCDKWGLLVDYDNKGQKATWDEKMTRKSDEVTCAQIERRMAAKQREEDRRMSASITYVKKPNPWAGVDYYTSIEARRNELWAQYDHYKRNGMKGHIRGLLYPPNEYPDQD